VYARENQNQPILNLNNITKIQWPNVEEQKNGKGATFISDIWNVDIRVPVEAMGQIQTKEVASKASLAFSEDLRYSKPAEKNEAVIYKPGHTNEQGLSQNV
jgi:hypothetical protein